MCNSVARPSNVAMGRAGALWASIACTVPGMAGALHRIEGGARIFHRPSIALQPLAGHAHGMKEEGTHGSTGNAKGSTANVNGHLLLAAGPDRERVFS
jgi:hypothetical protein